MDGSNFRKGVQNGLLTDIASVQNDVHTLDGLQHLRPQQAVGIG